MSDDQPRQLPTVEVDSALAGLAPSYLERRRQEIPVLRALLQAARWDELRQLAHQIKGSGGGFGFERITELGEDIEAAARARETADARGGIDRLERFVNDVRVVTTGECGSA